MHYLSTENSTKSISKNFTDGHNPYVRNASIKKMNITNKKPYLSVIYSIITKENFLNKIKIRQ